MRRLNIINSLNLIRKNIDKMMVGMKVAESLLNQFFMLFVWNFVFNFWMCMRSAKSEFH